jgi:glyoxylate/hydroxypyruvate reductase
MQRISQLSSHLAKDPVDNSANSSPATPHRAHPANNNTTITTMAKLKVVVTRQLIDSAQKLLDAKNDVFEIVQWNSEKVQPTPPHHLDTSHILTPSTQPCPRPWLLEHAAGATGILVMLSDKVNEELLDAAGPSLKAIASFSVGTDHVDLAALKARNIRLGYTPTCLTDAVADLTVMLILMAQRRAGEAIAKVNAGEWPQMPWHPLLMTGPSIRGATVGFLGFGRIAQASLVRLLPFGIKRVVYLTSKPGKPARDDHYGVLKDSRIPITPAQNLDELARESDVVIVSCALTPETHHIISTPFFEKMKPTAVIVNIARGGVIDTNALVEVLDEEKIFGAGLDVIEGEPVIEKDHPILRQKRCVLLPHVGSATTETREMMAVESVRNLVAGVEGGEMVNEVEL